MIRGLIASAALAVTLAVAPTARAAEVEERAVAALDAWWRMTLELVRHTPTYSPPVASRAFAYLGVAGFETAAAGPGGLATLSGRLEGFAPLAPPAAPIDRAVALNAALDRAVAALFANTGPTGQRAMARLGARLEETTAAGVDPDRAAASAAWGAGVADAVLAWAATDGGATVENMGFPTRFDRPDDPARWVPTSLIAQQQAPLLPDWGANRPIGMPAGRACALPPPPPYDEAEGSAFRAEAEEVRAIRADLTAERRAIARFWSDDPMLSPTPPGHWISIALQVLDSEDAELELRLETLAKLGIALSDGFVACWREKFVHDLVRPVTYIRRTMDPAWEPLLTTPPFPEYPSGHSTQSAAAAVVLTDLFGDDYAFVDRTHEDDGLPARAFPSFDAAAEEAALSRLYGGIHYRSAIARGLDQGRCVGAYAAALETRE